MRSPANLRSSAVAATALAVAGCGGGKARDDGSARANHTVAIERVAFPARQRIAQQSAFAVTVRNAGQRTIGDLTVTLRGLSAHEAHDVPQRPLWLLDAPPAGGVAGSGDAYATGPLAAGRSRTLRWRLTAVAAGTHELEFEVAGAHLRDGRRARGARVVRVLENPPFARVDPRTGRVVRE